MTDETETLTTEAEPLAPAPTPQPMHGVSKNAVHLSENDALSLANSLLEQGIDPERVAAAMKASVSDRLLRP